MNRVAQLRALMTDMVREGYRFSIENGEFWCPFNHMDCDGGDPGSASIDVVTPTQQSLTIDLDNLRPDLVAGTRR